MPTPISSNNSSVYDLSTSTSTCDPSNATCAAPATAADQSAAPAAVTIPPVYVEGDAGKDLLLKRFDAAPKPQCHSEMAGAALTCAAVGSGILTTVASAPTVIGAAAGIYATLVASAGCGMELRNLLECERQ